MSANLWVMKVNVWTCALATDRDLDSVQSKSICVRTRKMTFSWSLVAILTCKSFVTFRSARFLLDSWS